MFLTIHCHHLLLYGQTMNYDIGFQGFWTKKKNTTRNIKYLFTFRFKRRRKIESIGKIYWNLTLLPCRAPPAPTYSNPSGAPIPIFQISLQNRRSVISHISPWGSQSIQCQGLDARITRRAWTQLDHLGMWRRSQTRETTWMECQKKKWFLFLT